MESIKKLYAEQSLSSPVLRAAIHGILDESMLFENDRRQAIREEMKTFFGELCESGASFNAIPKKEYLNLAIGLSRISNKYGVFPSWGIVSALVAEITNIIRSVGQDLPKSGLVNLENFTVPGLLAALSLERAEVELFNGAIKSASFTFKNQE